MNDNQAVEGGMFGETNVDVEPGSFQVVGNGLGDRLETSLGLDPSIPVNVPTTSKKVSDFESLMAGKEPDGAASGEGQDLTNKTLNELLEANKRLVSALGRQGSEVVGPQRKMINDLQQEIAELRGRVNASVNPPDNDRDLRLAASGLFPGEDPDDDVVRRHTRAHVAASNLVMQSVREEVIEPLKRELQAVRAQLSAQQVTGLLNDIPADVIASITDKYPLLTDANLPADQRASMIRQLYQGSGQRRLAAGSGPHRDAATHVEGTNASGATRTVDGERVAQAFAGMGPNDREAALRRLLTNPGALRGLGM